MVGILIVLSMCALAIVIGFIICLIIGYIGNCIARLLGCYVYFDIKETATSGLLIILAMIGILFLCILVYNASVEVNNLILEGE